MEHAVTHARLHHIIGRLPRRAVLVVGDAMLDEYLWGEVNRISPEAPVPVVEVQSQTLKLGGAANVAGNLASLGVTAHLVSLCGADANGERLRGLLRENGLAAEGLFSSRERRTTLKTRIIAHHQQIVRADHESRAPLSEDEHALLLNHVKSLLGEVDGVILSDYAKGTLSPGLVQAVLGLCREHELYSAVDPKTHDFAVYRGASIVTPNLKEALAAVGLPPQKCPEDRVQQVGWQIVERGGFPFLLVTLGEQGMAVFQAQGRKYQHLRTAAREVFDVTGAGDTVISTFTAASCAGATPFEAAFLANVAAGMTVAELGTATVDRKDLLARSLEESAPRPGGG